MARKSYTKRARKTRRNKRNKSMRRKRGGNANDLSKYLQTLGQGSERDNLRLAFRAIQQSTYNIIKDEELKNELHRLQGINNIKFLDVRSPDDPPLDNAEAEQIANGIVDAFRKM